MLKKNIVNNKNLNLNNKFHIFLLLLLFVIFIHSTNFFQNLAKVLTLSKEKRINDVYGYCTTTGIGYINHLKKKYKFKSNPDLLHNPFYPRLDWSFFDFNKREVPTDELIIVNYQGQEFKKTFTRLSESQFRVKRIYNIKKIVGVEFFGNFENLKNEKVTFDIRLSNKERSVNRDGKFNITISNKEVNYFPIDIGNIQHDDKLRYLQLNFLSNNEFIERINSVNVYFKNKIDIKNYQIIDNFENCYYLKKNV